MFIVCEGKTINEIAKQFDRSWGTIDRMVKIPREELQCRGKRSRKSPVATPEVISAVEDIINKEREHKVKKKQKYTAVKIFNELTENGIYKGSKRQMTKIVKKARKKLGQPRNRSFLPLDFDLGSCLQVDHGEVYMEIEKKRVLCFLFVSSVPGATLRYCQVFPNKTQEAWGEFTERSFIFFGGIFSVLTYDNDSVLIKKVFGNEHIQTSFSLSLEEHYGFTSHFCNIAAGNEKGSVENAVGFCRRNYLAGLPSYSSWDEVNKFLEESCRKEIDTGLNYKTNEPLKDLFTKIKSMLSPILPRYTWSKRDKAAVNSLQLVRTDKHFYSVPERFLGRSLFVVRSIFNVAIFDGEELIVSHPRKFIPGEDSLLLDHYLNQLNRKPSAFWDCKAVKNHQFHEEFQDVWKKLFDRNEKREAIRKFIEILLLNRRYKLKDLIEAIRLGLSYGFVEAAAIENIVKQLNTVTEITCDENTVRKSLPNVNIIPLQFDLSQYASLCKEGLC